MDCPEKEALQRRCAAAWEAYEAAVKRCGFPCVGRRPIPRSMSEWTRVSFNVDPQAGKPALSAAYSTAIFLRGEHLKASRELSRHLSSHCC
jgi:hypothetical protein